MMMMLKKNGLRWQGLGLVLIVVIGWMSQNSMALPAGFTTFFDGKECPEGWYTPDELRGRMLVSVGEGSLGGVTVNKPLLDQEDRHHVHHYTTALNLPVKHVAAIGCCDGDGGCAGLYQIQTTTSSHTSSLPFTQLTVCTANVSHPALVGVQVGIGTVGYFTSDVTSCPSQWNTVDYTNGRVLIPAYDQTIVVSKTAALKSGQDLVHAHNYVATVNVSAQSFAGVDGCCNDELGGSGSYKIPGITDDASSGLPYIQMLTCVCADETLQTTKVPDEGLLWNEVACPTGYNQTTDVAGRFLVANPKPGEAGASFGGDNLLPLAKETRNHTHAMDASVSIPSCEIGLVAGCCSDGYAKHGSYDFIAQSDEGNVAIPFVSMQLCTKT